MAARTKERRFHFSKDRNFHQRRLSSSPGESYLFVCVYVYVYVYRYVHIYTSIIAAWTKERRFHFSKDRSCHQRRLSSSPGECIPPSMYMLLAQLSRHRGGGRAPLPAALFGVFLLRCASDSSSCCTAHWDRFSAPCLQCARLPLLSTIYMCILICLCVSLFPYLYIYIL